MRILDWAKIDSEYNLEDIHSVLEMADEQADLCGFLFLTNHPKMAKKMGIEMLNPVKAKKVALMKSWLFKFSKGAFNEQYWKDLEAGKVNENYWAKDSEKK